MPEQAVAAAGQAGGQQQQGQSTLMKVVQGVVIWMGVQMVIKQFMGGNNSAATTTVRDASGNEVAVPANNQPIPPYLLRPSELNEGAVYNPIPQRLAPIWPDKSYVDIVVTLSPSFVPAPLASVPEKLVLLRESRFQLGNYSEARVADRTFDVPASVQHNGTLWGHFYVGLSGSVLDPSAKGFDPASAHHVALPLTQYLPLKKVKKVRNLLDDKAPDPAADEDELPAGPIIANFYHPNASWSFVPEMGGINYPSSHPAIRQFLRLEPTGARDGTGQNTWYYPIIFLNTFFQLRSQMIQLNDTVTTLPIHIDLNNVASWKFTTMAAIEMSSKQAALSAAFGNSLPGGGDGSEIEMVKGILLDTNPILLGITVVVSIAHILLEMLAFGSDISHYRKKKDNVGISVRSILANVFMQTVIFLYLLDNSQNTSWMILGSQVIGIGIEFWKITTVVNVRLRPAPPGSLIPYRIFFEDSHKLSETEEKTKEYDEIAFRYLYVAAVPLLLAYAVYSLVYDSHKSWYSYIITTLVGSVYAYGFLMMVPSLYINYRLKSVAHMPAKAMAYKFVGTFIDDLFAFTIKMPLLHRLATFRDDIIFFIYIYQRWVYKIDYTRVNEFGQGGDDEGDAVPALVDTKKVAEKDAPAAPAGTKLESAAAAKTTGAEGASAKATKRK